MKISKIFYPVVFIMLAFLFVGCGSSSKSIVGTWVDDKDKITFSKDGTFSAYFYFMDGEWNEFEDGKVDIIQELAGSEKYFYEITDDGVLILKNAIKNDDGTWHEGGYCYRFVREGKDTSILDEASKSVEEPSDSTIAAEEAPSEEIEEVVQDPKEAAASDASIMELTTEPDTISDLYTEEAAILLVKNYIKIEVPLDIDSDDDISLGYEKIDDEIAFEIWNENKSGDHPMMWGMGTISLIDGTGTYDDRINMTQNDSVNYFEYE